MKESNIWVNLIFAFILGAALFSSCGHNYYSPTDDDYPFDVM